MFYLLLYKTLIFKYRKKQCKIITNLIQSFRFSEKNCIFSMLQFLKINFFSVSQGHPGLSGPCGPKGMGVSFIQYGRIQGSYVLEKEKCH